MLGILKVHAAVLANGLLHYYNKSPFDCSGDLFSLHLFFKEDDFFEQLQFIYLELDDLHLLPSNHRLQILISLSDLRLGPAALVLAKCHTLAEGLALPPGAGEQVGHRPGDCLELAPHLGEFLLHAAEQGPGAVSALPQPPGSHIQGPALLQLGLHLVVPDPVHHAERADHLPLLLSHSPIYTGPLKLPGQLQSKALPGSDN